MHLAQALLNTDTAGVDDVRSGARHWLHLWLQQVVGIRNRSESGHRTSRDNAAARDLQLGTTTPTPNCLQI
jgi:hypothetical protein